MFGSTSNAYQGHSFSSQTSGVANTQRSIRPGGLCELNGRDLNAPYPYIEELLQLLSPNSDQREPSRADNLNSRQSAQNQFHSASTSKSLVPDSISVQSILTLFVL